MSKFFSSFGLCVAILGGHLAYADPLHDAAKTGDMANATVLLENGADINAADSFGTPLHWAILNKHDAVAELLIAEGADINRLTDALGSPLHATAQRGLPEQTRLLVSKGADVDVRDKDGKTPLHIAAYSGRTEVASVLIEVGADVNSVAFNAHGSAWGEGEFTALHIAKYRRHTDIADLLRDAGAGPRVTPPPEGVIASGDPIAGAEIAIKCGRCHMLTEGQPDPSHPNPGPPLMGVIGRAIASFPDFEYTTSLSAMGGEWTEERLYGFIRHPMTTAPGTRMVFEEARTPQDVADVIAFLRRQAN
ncbi:ankyrin repeat domain-containing protein [Actibacterium pelagium]|uniref:Cytochrome c domain-containing protein n=1 Tax=Actibacterium pelagium TaxID=2029103 RepID=A0A917AM34_9RHOB|nr:ankyrin repeat domain-containing protein [Actibacterium pelagium]GGE61438.1 hypothetical protein GCM10011517_31210 [Actibacterium pelagium]